MEEYKNPARDKWPQLISRPVSDNKSLFASVQKILQSVKKDGDKALYQFTRQFDGVDLKDIWIKESEMQSAVSRVPQALKDAISLAAKNIRMFHEPQLGEVQVIETVKGIRCWRKPVAIERVGLYIPGGSAPLFSTVLMLAIPAQIAGCPEIVVCTPPDSQGKVNDVILYTAHLLGIHKIAKVGGAQAIAAMAYGTDSVPAVNKIFGPGNQYVTTAKQLVLAEGVAIDLPAGPSELAVFADDTAIPSFVAADLLSQAEHGPDSQVLLVTTASEMLAKVKKEIEIQKQRLSRNEIMKQSLAKSRMVLLDRVEDCFALLNAYAPEHLIIASKDAEKLSENVINAGSVFLGNYAPESAGDYISGTNHTLPTYGYARAWSGVSVDSFVKKITFQKIEKEGLSRVAKEIECMAMAEGLDAHKNAVSIRFETH